MPHTPLNPDLPQRWRLRNPSSGREVVLSAEPGIHYVDRKSGEEMEITGRLLPLAPTPSLLPWAVENLSAARRRQASVSNTGTAGVPPRTVSSVARV